MSDNTADLTSGEKQILKQAGASDALIRVVELDLTETVLEKKTWDGEIERVTRNSVLQEVKKYLRDGHTPPQLTLDTVNDFEPYGGHFFMAIWEGDLYEAYGRADSNNTRIMEVLFDAAEVNAGKPAHRDLVMV